MATLETPILAIAVDDYEKFLKTSQRTNYDYEVTMTEDNIIVNRVRLQNGTLFTENREGQYVEQVPETRFVDQLLEIFI